MENLQTLERSITTGSDKNTYQSTLTILNDDDFYQGVGSSEGF